MLPFRAISVALLTIALMGSSVALADEGRYVTNEYQDEMFEWSDSWRDSTVGPRNNISQVDGHVGSGVRVAIDRGEHFGAAMRWRFEDNGLAEPEELWFRYYLRFPEGFENVGKGKLPGPAGLYSLSGRGNVPSTPVAPGWSARMLFSPTYDDRNETHTRIGYYVYHVDQQADHGDLLPWAEATATLEHGRWYCVEGAVSMNTPGHADGSLTGWVDGEPAFSSDSFQFRRSGEEHVRVDSFWFDVYYGGREPAPAALSIDFDSLAFGPDRLGCDDSGDRGFDGDFFDDDGSPHQEDIEALRAAGVVDGCNANGDAFCPEEGLTRGQLAKLLSRALELPDTSTDFFSDDDGSPFESAINAVAAAGITNGCGPGLFCPDRVASRAELAAFVSRALDLPDTEADYFEDDNSSPFQEAVNSMAAAGLTYGCGEERFCPDSEVSREQAASFVVRAMTTLADRAAAEPPPPPSPQVRRLFEPRPD